MKNTNDTTVISLEKFESKDFSGCLPSLLDAAANRDVFLQVVIPVKPDFIHRPIQQVQDDLSLLFFGSESALMELSVTPYHEHEYDNGFMAWMVNAIVNPDFIEEVKQEMKNFR